MKIIIDTTANCHQTWKKNPPPTPLQSQQFIRFFPPLRGD